MLDYHHASVKHTAGSVLGLVGLPIAAAMIAFMAFANVVYEPFRRVTVGDAAIFAGAPVGILGSLAAWFLLARRHRLRWFVVTPVVAWFLLFGCVSIQSLLSYLQDLRDYGALGG